MEDESYERPDGEEFKVQALKGRYIERDVCVCVCVCMCFPERG